MEIKNLNDLSAAVRDPHLNFVVEEIDQHCLRMAVNEPGAYEWHSHPGRDELFVVLEGELMIEFKDRPTAILRPMDTLRVPRDVVHRTSMKVRTVNLCFEHTQAETVFLKG